MVSIISGNKLIKNISKNYSISKSVIGGVVFYPIKLNHTLTETKKRTHIGYILFQLFYILLLIFTFSYLY